MSQSWIAELPSSSPQRPSTQRPRSKTPQMPFTPGQPLRKTPTPALQSTAPSFGSPTIDPSLRGQSVEGSPATPPPAQRPSVGCKQPKRHLVEENSSSGTESGSDGSSENDDSSVSDGDVSIPAKRRRLARKEGERLGLSARSVADAKKFATVSSRLFTIKGFLPIHTDFFFASVIDGGRRSEHSAVLYVVSYQRQPRRRNRCLESERRCHSTCIGF